MIEYKIIPEREVISLASYIDGEGSIYIRKTKGTKNNIHTLDVEISMTHKPTIEHIYTTFGIGSFRPVKRRKKAAHHKQAWKVNWTSRDAVVILNLISPYLLTKKEEAELALEFATLKQTRVGRAGLSEEMVEKREEYYLNLKELKLINYPMEEEIVC